MLFALGEEEDVDPEEARPDAAEPDRAEAFEVDPVAREDAGRCVRTEEAGVAFEADPKVGRVAVPATFCGSGGALLAGVAAEGRCVPGEGRDMEPDGEADPCALVPFFGVCFSLPSCSTCTVTLITSSPLFLHFFTPTQAIIPGVPACHFASDRRTVACATSWVSYPQVLQTAR